MNTNKHSISRRAFVTGTMAVAAGSALLSRVSSKAESIVVNALPTNAVSTPRAEVDTRYRPVITPNGDDLPWKLIDGVKVFHLIAEEVPRHEFAPGLVAHCWGFNGRMHGPTIQAVEGDKVRIYVTNKLPAATSIHWHGIFLPNGMDGVAGLTQKSIEPGETYKYEFTLKQHGTYAYHSHHDEMTQMALGLMGLFVIHPGNPQVLRPDRDFAFLLSEWKVSPGTMRPDPNEMVDFNIFTLNGKVFPATAPMVSRMGDRVRIRLANLGAMDHHPMHIHGHRFRVTETDGGQIPEHAQQLESTVLVHVGSTRTIDFVADAPGDWPFHCHMTHHTMNQMGHSGSNMLGVDKTGLDKKIRKFVPGYMTMGETGMAEMGEMGMKSPTNSIPMVGGPGPFEYISMGGMFTMLKVREGITSYDDPGWYKHPPGTVARAATEEELKRDGIELPKEKSQTAFIRLDQKDPSCGISKNG
ncbi:MAG: multicopper oxidase protein [Verrucomicrobiales bacterium]|nr:multicopper oxidase protein [Verrucomicrobiales bacterium]